MDKEFTFTLTLEESNHVLAGLQELPAKFANPIIQKMQLQAQPQLKDIEDNKEV